MQEDLKDKEQEIQRLRRQLEQEKDKNSSSSNSGSSQTSSKYECSYCDSVSKERDWSSSEKNKQGFCPKCGQGTKDNATEA